MQKPQSMAREGWGGREGICGRPRPAVFMDQACLVTGVWGLGLAKGFWHENHDRVPSGQS